jgi:hypothetical protein
MAYTYGGGRRETIDDVARRGGEATDGEARRRGDAASVSESERSAGASAVLREEEEVKRARCPARIYTSRPLVAVGNTNRD